MAQETELRLGSSEAEGKKTAIRKKENQAIQ